MGHKRNEYQNSILAGELLHAQDLRTSPMRSWAQDLCMETRASGLWFHGLSMTMVPDIRQGIDKIIWAARFAPSLYTALVAVSRPAPKFLSCSSN